LTDSTFGVAKQLHTIADYIRWGASRFNEAGLYFGHGSDNAVDDSLFLVLHALHLPPGLAPELMQASLTDEEKGKILGLFERRIHERLPVPYLTHEAWFGGLKFFVDERVLIPRSPIIELIEKRFSDWLVPEEVESVLDLCTGSGCIAIACATVLPWAEVDGLDISEDAIDVANINIERHQLAGQVQVIQSDLFSAVQGKRYDLIVSNPPYVDAEDMGALPREFRHEPELALASGDDGLDIPIKILAQAVEHLTEHGILVLEVGNSGAALEARFPEVPFEWVEFERGGHGVFVLHAATLQEFQTLFENALSA